MTFAEFLYDLLFSQTAILLGLKVSVIKRVIKRVIKLSIKGKSLRFDWWIDNDIDMLFCICYNANRQKRYE